MPPRFQLRARCRADVETIQRALTGTWRAEHLFALEQALALYDACQEKVVACDKKIEATLKSANAAQDAPTNGATGARLPYKKPHVAGQKVRAQLPA